MHHRIGPRRPHLHAHFSRSAQPILSVDSGDRISFTVPDVAWGLAPPTSTTAPRQKVEPRDPARDNGPCMCGPVEIRGARPGDALEILIEEVRTAPWGWTYAGGSMARPSWNQSLGIGDSPLALLRWTLDDPRRLVTDQHGRTVIPRPFPGVIGLSPDEEHASGWVPRNCGGNMDCREISAGSTLYLPVMVPGGLLSAGDGHIAQGDGEVSGTAIETMLEELRVRVILHPAAAIPGPRVRTPDGAWVTLGFGDSLDAAAAEAMRNMLDLMVTQTGLTRAEALAAASSTVDLRVTQLVNPRLGIHAVWRSAGS
jgi:acetamidase/formamidase